MGKEAQKNRSEAEERQFWQMVLETHRLSGLAVKQFCRNEGLSEWRFYHWKKKLQSGSASVPLSEDSVGVRSSGANRDEGTTAGSAPSFRQIAQLSSGETPGLRIEFPGGIWLHISDGCNRQLLQAAVAILRERPC